MNWTLYRDHLANARTLNTLLMVIVVGLVVALIANGFYRRTVVLHVAPVSVEREYWASSNQASDQYKKEIALSLIPYVANVSPASVRLGHQTFLRYVAEEAYGQLSEALRADEEYVTKNNLNRFFSPEYARVSGDEVVLGGKERRFIGHTQVAEEDREYRIVLKFTDWRVHVSSLSAGLFTRKPANPEAQTVKMPPSDQPEKQP
ncbi:MAG: TraE/TraK family type IV conjugative transfer system protein [Nitrospirota bacterium]